MLGLYQCRSIMPEGASERFNSFYFDIRDNEAILPRHIADSYHINASITKEMDGKTTLSLIQECHTAVDLTFSIQLILKLLWSSECFQTLLCDYQFTDAEEPDANAAPL